MRGLRSWATENGGGARCATRGAIAVAVALFASVGLPRTAAATTASPVWRLTATSQPTELVPGSSSPQGILVVATNVGAADTDGAITLTDDLPPGLLPAPQPEGCEAQGQLIKCVIDKVVHPGESLVRFLPATVTGTARPTSANVTTVVGGGARTESIVETGGGASPPAFGFLPGRSGFDGSLNAPDGAPVTQAGATPYELVVGIGFPTEMIESELANASDPRDVAIDLPPGLSLDPSATPRCRPSRLEEGSCPAASQVGLIGIGLDIGSIAFENLPLYNVVPPPGYASDFGFVLGAAGVVMQLLGSVRSDEFGLSAQVGALPDRYPILGVQLQLWGNPSDPSHNAVRGSAVEPLMRPLVTLPGACGPVELDARVDSWEDPGSFISRSVPFESLTGDWLEVEGCSGLGFEPALSVQPTTTMADRPAGLQLKVEVPQQLDPQGSTTSSLRRATATLPPRMVINPSAVGGAAVCSPAQVGLVSGVDEPKPRFNDAATSCPDASKVGTVEALSPLLRDEAENGAPRPHPLLGAVYLAQPRRNPFGAEFALYVVIEDPETGIVVKLAGEVVADPSTGQVTATFNELPPLSFEEFKLDFFGGPRAILRTPAVCGEYFSHAGMTPWSGTATVEAESRFSIAASPSGGPCATSQGQLPNAPRFDAGTALPAAGRYSPFVLNLSRNDGSQELEALNVTLPVGLSGRLAGSSRCSDTEIATASSKSGAEEVASPSCPAASQVGHVLVDLGAGSSPYQAEGKVYLAGPYRGAPLSLAVVTPAVAGPFDLGTVVVRAAVSVDPTTGQISVKSDPLPTMLDGVPLDIRSLQLDLDKPELIRNPTSCEPGAVSAEAVSTLGQVAPLSSRFQVGNCAALPFKPKLTLKMSGAHGRNGHPALRATLHADASGATLKSASFALPGSELLDLHHVRELCSRNAPVGQCPSRSRLGSIRLSSPLLEAPLQGAVYLRVPTRRLPDISAEVRSEGLSFVLSGRTTDSDGQLGVSLDSLPDTPFSSAVLTLSGGRRGILVNSHSLCGKRTYAVANFSAHNGMRRGLRVPVRVAGCR